MEYVMCFTEWWINNKDDSDFPNHLVRLTVLTYTHANYDLLGVVEVVE